jgi:hypothetical protein
MKPHEVRPNVKKEKRAKYKAKWVYTRFYASGGLCATKEPAPYRGAKKKKNRPKTAARKAVCAGLCVPPTDFTTRAHRDTYPNRVLRPHEDHSPIENKKEGPL